MLAIEQLQHELRYGMETVPLWRAELSMRAALPMGSRREGAPTICLSSFLLARLVPDEKSELSECECTLEFIATPVP